MTKCAYLKKICSLCLLRQGINRLRPSARHYTRGTRREIPNQQSLGEVRDFERFHTYIYIYNMYIYILHDMFHDIRIAELEVKCLPGRRSPSDEFPFNLLWTSFRMMEDSPWERKHFELPWILSCKNFRVQRGLGGYTVKICENMWTCWCSTLRSDPSRRPSTAMEAWQQHDLR